MGKNKLNVDKTIAGITTCDGDSRGNNKCDLDDSHRVCASIKNTDFFSITTMPNVNDRIGKGGHWCVPMYALEEYVTSSSCDAITIDCNATGTKVCMGRDTSLINPHHNNLVKNARSC